LSIPIAPLKLCYLSKKKEGMEKILPAGRLAETIYVLNFLNRGCEYGGPPIALISFQLTRKE